jgi:hypothetical protein
MVYLGIALVALILELTLQPLRRLYHAAYRRCGLSAMKA